MNEPDPVGSLGVASLESLHTFLAAEGRRHQHCIYCGRQMVDIEEPASLFDKVSGERSIEVWRQCPRYPKNSFQALYRGTHQSFLRDNPVVGRAWQ